MLARVQFRIRKISSRHRRQQSSSSSNNSDLPMPISQLPYYSLWCNNRTFCSNWIEMCFCRFNSSTTKALETHPSSNRAIKWERERESWSVRVWVKMAKVNGKKEWMNGIGMKMRWACYIFSFIVIWKESSISIDSGEKPQNPIDYVWLTMNCVCARECIVMWMARTIYTHPGIRETERSRMNN